MKEWVRVGDRDGVSRGSAYRYDCALFPAINREQLARVESIIGIDIEWKLKLLSRERALIYARGRKGIIF